MSDNVGAIMSERTTFIQRKRNSSIQTAADCRVDQSAVQCTPPYLHVGCLQWVDGGLGDEGKVVGSLF